MVEGYKELFEKDAAAMSLIGEEEKKGAHLSLLFTIAHSSLMKEGNDDSLNQMKGFEYLCNHLDSPLNCDWILGILGAMQGKEKGEWKTSNNFFDSGENFYVTLPYDKTPAAMADLCERFAYLNEPKPEQFEDIFLFVLHFICIHPLQNGNGRVMAFLLQLLLYKAGLKAAIYLPIDALMIGLYYSKTTIEIHKASGSFYGRKELDLTSYTPYMMGLISKSYDLLIESKKA